MTATPSSRRTSSWRTRPSTFPDWGQDKLLDDVRWQYGTPPAGNANFAWLQHMIWHLAPNGRIGMVLANGSLSSQSGGEGEIRKNIINADLVDCIVAMPSQLFYTTQIPGLPVVPGQEQEAEGQDPVHRRPEDGHHGDPQAAGADRRGHPASWPTPTTPLRTAPWRM